LISFNDSKGFIILQSLKHKMTMSGKWGIFMMVDNKVEGVTNAANEQILYENLQISVKGGGGRGIKKLLGLQIGDLYTRARKSSEIIRKLKETADIQAKTIDRMKEEYEWAKRDALEQFDEMCDQTRFVEGLDKVKTDATAKQIEALTQRVKELEKQVAKQNE